MERKLIPSNASFPTINTVEAMLFFERFTRPDIIDEPLSTAIFNLVTLTNFHIKKKSSCDGNPEVYLHGL